MKSFLKNIFSTIIGTILSIFIIIFLLIGIFSVSLSSIKNESEVLIKDNSILQINLSNISIVERKSENPFDNLNFSSEIPKTIALKEILDNIEKAKTDDNIKAIYIYTSYINGRLSQIEEIRNKLLEFKATGKPIIAYSEVYSQTAYYLASLANKIYLNPQGIIEIKGLSASIMFYKGLLEKLNIDVQIIRQGKFKSAIEPFFLDKMSEENRSQLETLLNSIANNILDSIASQRGLKLSKIKEHADNLMTENAVKCLNLKYVDALLYEDQVEDTLISLTESEKINIISLNKYSKVKTNKKEISRDKIAIIYATGEIKSGKGDSKSIGSITTSKAIKTAREDKRVKAIVLRINSPGGSALASDVILREVMLTKVEKPVVVSMGDVAASGGYYIACAADSIVANPTTITGSIGVFGVIPNLQALYKNKLGITIDTVNTNKYADIGMNRPLTKFEKNKIQKNIEDIYTTFITHVSKGRAMSLVEVDNIGQGRVWSGYSSKKIGLIDTYGGIEKAIDIAAYLANISEYRIINLPKKKDPFTEIALSLGNKSHISKSLFSKIGFNTNLSEPIETILRNDKIQARMPFIIELK